ncbi:MAG TPA: signal peptidase I, partial [Xanthobacteraceae bacterium]
MTSLADCAPAEASEENERRGPSPWITALLTVLTPGLGHIYLGQARRGITLFAFVMVADTLLMFAMMGVLARFWMFAVSLGLLLGLWLFIMVDAIGRAHRMRDHPHEGYNRWTTYAGAFVLACIIFAGPVIYAVHANASGQLLVLNAVTPSMEPTLRVGEYFLADATYYRSRAPSRGDVAVYLHPKQSHLYYIKRIVAVEGDRIAIKGGRAVVNGMMVEEPYVDAGAAEGRFANMPEVRVPAGHVYVLGDNRSNSVDSRDTVAHGAVPVANLIGRVTDIAISRHLPRIGRWVGTPS